MLLRDNQGSAQTGGTMEKQVLPGCFRGVLAATLLLVTHPRALSPDSLDYSSGKQGTFSCIPYLALSLGVSAFLDSPVHNHFQDTGASWTGFASVSDLAGEKAVLLPAVVLAYGAGRYLFRDEGLQAASLASAKALAISFAAVEGIKQLAGRARPFTGEGSASFQPFPGRDDRYRSLPSGHTAAAFAAVTPFAERYSRWLYLVPAAVAVGRVAQDRHWVTDVVLGGGIGFISGRLFTNELRLFPGGVEILF